ncbi:L-rhamnose isomerase [Alkalispirochaeta alkalica]|uniref:L-rhamnose isomerase n=1 Tax=Alkalispirochaeta alkalica TaxID=46356 RepID=UPI000378F415|nr:L-rhamnose isomerase [Alkalispirochaeta alkalica]
MFSAPTEQHLEQAYHRARDEYADLGIDTGEALQRLARVAVSINCWQGDDVAGFEGQEGITGGGILATGEYPGKARNPDELRRDFEMAYSLIPGKHRFNLHAMYRESDNPALDRDGIGPEHFSRWMDWAREMDLALDFNPTFFSHPLAKSGYTLASRDEKVRAFWIEHGKRSRQIAAHLGAHQGSASINNFWVPDGSKDEPADRLAHRELLIQSLDEIFSLAYPREQTLDAVESKLFGIGSEAFVAGSHDFYLAYAISRGVMLTMDAGHYHPTESVAEKISAVLPFCQDLLLHLSRPIRWDSDHVVIFDDATRDIFREVQRARSFDRVHLAVDFFDASINRIAAWVIGVRSALKAALFALLEPTDLLVAAEESGDTATRLALQQELLTLPFGAVWDKFCLDQGVPPGRFWLAQVKEYEQQVLRKRQ